MRKILLLAFALSMLSGCTQRIKHQVDFYYWKRNVSFGETEKKYFRNLNSEKLYIRFFDIDVDTYGYPTPKSKIALFDPRELNAAYIPVVFITNRTFKDMKRTTPEKLAARTYELIETIAKKNNINEFNEIQIDCDWTAVTKDDFFKFLTGLGKVAEGKTISSTLRLHQVKDRNIMGVPPVGKVYLMCYATASPKDPETANSILDIELLKNYTRDMDNYPVEMDIALPLYSWGIVTNHRGEIKLINNADTNGMIPEYFIQTGENTYEAVTDFFFQGIYLNKGFTMRVEKISPALLKEAKSYLDSKIKKDYNIVYYHLDKPFIEKFTIDELK